MPVMPTPTRRPFSSPAFTLLELMVVLVLLGIAGAMVIPSMGESHILRVQGALRQLVSDISFAQSDAVAFQESRAVVFDVANSTYTLVAVPGTTIDLVNNTLYDATRPGGTYGANFTDNHYGDARIAAASFGGSGGPTATIVFDAMGGLIGGPGDNTPGSGGSIRINGAKQSFIITVEAFTGRTTVAQDKTYRPPP